MASEDEFEFEVGRDPEPPEENPPLRAIDPHLNGNFELLEKALNDQDWMIALDVLRALVQYVHMQLESSGFMVDVTTGSGYCVHTVDHRFAIPFRWATDALEYAQELVEMGYEPNDPTIFDKLLAAKHREEAEYNQWLDDEAEKWDNWS